MAVTYARLDLSELYNVSRDGVIGAMSRVLVEVNFPVSLVGIALALIALDALPSRWWTVGGPAIALCAVTAIPGVVDDDDLDAKLVNALPAVGVAAVLILTATAAARTGYRFSPRRPFDAVRITIAAVVLLLSLPWFAADLGVFFPEGIFIAERPIADDDGTVSPAVHLGHHHGFDGALIVISALLLSRPRLRSPALSTAARLYVSLMFAYGAVNFGQDLWNEQVQKRGWVDWSIPSASEPSLTAIWLLILAMTAAAALIMRYEADRLDRLGPAGRLAEGG